MKLFMVLVGCTPKGRNTEQHDVFFGIASNLSLLIPDIINWWPEAEGRIHIDAWREVNYVEGFTVTIERNTGIQKSLSAEHRLFFINLGGYKPYEFEEYHYKMLAAATTKSAAIQASKQTAFFLHTGFEGAISHIDDKYGIDVDDVFEIADILDEKFKKEYKLSLNRVDSSATDELHIGYLKLNKILH